MFFWVSYWFWTLGRWPNPFFEQKPQSRGVSSHFKIGGQKWTFWARFQLCMKKWSWLGWKPQKLKYFYQIHPLEPSPGSFSGKNARFPKTVIFNLIPAKFLESAKTATKWAGNRLETSVIWFFTRKLSYQTISRLSPEKVYHKSVKS